MKIYTQEEFDAIKREDYGYRYCPTGDYTQIKIFDEFIIFDDQCRFGERCRFGGGCSFGEGCRFGDGCVFGYECIFCGCCSFNKGCSFGNRCSFDEGCEWSYFPMLIDFANMGSLSDKLTHELMCRDAESHPFPQAFDDWANGGSCPYGGKWVHVQRRHWFDERKDCWNRRFKRMTTAELIKAVAREKTWIIKEVE